jgi:hypothetical protein
MAATEGEIKLLARVTALEIVARRVLGLVAAATPDPIETLESWREIFREELSTSVVRGRDAAMSDLLVQELSERIDALLSSAITEVRRSLGDRTS